MEGRHGRFLDRLFDVFSSIQDVNAPRFKQVECGFDMLMGEAVRGFCRAFWDIHINTSALHGSEVFIVNAGTHWAVFRLDADLELFVADSEVPSTVLVRIVKELQVSARTALSAAD
jgi:hypothetical protein